MTLNGWLQILFFFALILAVTKPLGVFMVHVFNREKTFLDPVLRPVERLIYKLTGVNEEREMRWTEYAVAMLLFSAVSMLVLYLIQRLQGVLPFNPQHLVGVDSANDDELPDADGWLGLSQFRFGSHRHRARHSIHTRNRPARNANHRQLLG